MNENNFSNGVIWITGYSSAGKTTVSRKVESELKKLDYRTIYLDGDELRGIFGNSWKFDKKSRIELAYVYFRLCRHLSSQGYVVVISAVAMFDELLIWVKENIPNAIQIYLKVPQEERRERDASTKKIFINSNMNDDSYDEPTNADLVIKNHGGNDALNSSREIVNFFTSKATSDADRGRLPHWDKFYKKNIVPITPSSFCEFVRSQIVDGSKLLEIGCGNGRDAAYFANNGINVTAIDRSETAISECKKNHIELPVIFFNGLLDELKEVNRDEFDVIYSRFVIHAMPKNEEIAMLTKSFNLLKNNGQIYIECRSIKDPLALKGEIISPTERIHGHYRRFIIKDDLLERLENAGFSILDVIESNNLAVYKNDNPVVIRVKAEKILS
tara:strand:+ start:488 stop:1645 length:1158 start_codon:yes stop_codon:yes gene_type:complete